MSWRDHLPELDFSEGVSTRQYRVLFVIGLILGAAVIPNVSALMALFSSSYDVSGGVTYHAADGPAVNVTGSASVESGSPFADNETVALNTSEGNITFSSPARTNATIAASEINGTWTNVTSLDVSTANLTIDPEDKEQIVVGGDADALSYRSMTVGDGVTDFVYSGASGTTTLKLYGLPANTRIGLYDPQAGDILAGGETNSNGVLVVETPNSEHTVELVGSDGDPTFDDDSATPDGPQSSDPDELAINVTDADFPEDTLNVSFYLNGEFVGSDTLEDAGRANVTLSSSVGSGDWYAIAEDEYGQTTQSLTYSFQGPDKVYFWNESNPDELLDNTTIEATIYVGDQVYNRSTQNGTFNLSDLPADEELVMVARADGYYSRHIIIDSLVEQQNVYLLPDTNVSAVEVRFQIEDKTGSFPPDTTDVIVKKPITRNNSTDYEVVAADQASTNGFTTYLEEDVRYRLVVRNEGGDTRVLGAYTASVSETVTLTIGQLNFGAEGSDDAYQWDAAHENKSTGDIVKFNFSDPTNGAKDIDVRIYERGNESNVIHDENYDGPFGNLAVTQPVPNEYQGTTWVVEWDGTRDGERVKGKRVVGPNAGDFGMPLDSMWMSVASLGLLIVFGGMFGGVRASLGVGVIGVVGGFFWYIRWLPTEVGAGAVVLVLALAVFYAVASRRGGV